VAAGILALLAAVVVLGFPYLSVREVSTASDLRSRNPNAALRDLSRAADLNPLDANPALLAGTVALRSGNLTEADHRFHQAIDRDPGTWFPWFGDGLVASALGDSERAKQDYARAHAINTRSDAVSTALARVQTNHPLSPAAGLGMLTLAS
jgi:Flp pilus assembly protein TadD